MKRAKEGLRKMDGLGSQFSNSSGVSISDPLYCEMV